MQVSVETTEGLERKLTIAIPGDRVDTAVNARLQEAAQTIRLNGFRQGKVPRKFLEKKYGVDIPDAKASPDAFDTVRSICGVVNELRG